MSIGFKNYQITVNEISVKNNKLGVGNFQLTPTINTQIGRKDSIHFIQINVEVKSTDEKPFPLNIYASIIGTFEFESYYTFEEIEDFLKNEGFQIVYAQVRSMVTSVTSQTMMPPVILPSLVPNFKNNSTNKMN